MSVTNAYGPVVPNHVDIKTSMDEEIADAVSRYF